MADCIMPKTPAEAKALGVTKYFTGNPCPKGHISPRRTVTAGCIECAAEAQLRWARSNKDHVNARTRKWHVANKDTVTAQQRRWYLDNAERLREKAKVQGLRWRKANPDKHAATQRNRRARLRQCDGVHTAEDIAAIRKLQKDRCAVCRVKLNGGGEVDHIQPLLSGGENDRTNLQLLCEFCNRSKGAKDPIDFMQERGKLL